MIVVRLIAAAMALLAHMARSRPDIVHFFLPAGYLVGMPVALLTVRRIRVMSRRSLNNYQHKHPILGRVERLLHRTVSVALGNSRAVVRQLCEEGIGSGRIRLIYNGIDLESMKPRLSRTQVRARLSIPTDALVLITVANLISYKGHDDLLAALGRIRNELPESWRLLCVGSDLGMGVSLREKTVQHGLADHVLWLGQRDDVSELLAASDIGVLCSHQEGFSNAILEGMAASLPMVVTDVGGNTEAVIDGRCGLVVPPRSPDALAAAVLRLSRDAELRRTLGSAARQRVESKFSLEGCVAAYERLYEALINREFPLPGDPELEHKGQLA